MLGSRVVGLAQTEVAFIRVFFCNDFDNENDSSMSFGLETNQ